jgi:hypothetical protein
VIAQNRLDLDVSTVVYIAGDRMSGKGDKELRARIVLRGLHPDIRFGVALEDGFGHDQS